MSKNKGKVDPKAAVGDAPPPPPKDETADKLLDMYNDKRQREKLDLAEFAHNKFEHWEQYFGFSVERECLWEEEDFKTTYGKRAKMTRTFGASTMGMSSMKKTGDDQQKSKKQVTLAGSGAAAVSTLQQQQQLTTTTSAAAADQQQATTTAGDTTTMSPRRLVKPPAKDDQDPLQSATLSADAGIAMELFETLKFAPNEAQCKKGGFDIEDNAALELGELKAKEGEAAGATISVQEAAFQITKPYAVPTWRQSAAQCRLKKVRAIYRWICANIKVLPPTQPNTPATGNVTLAVPDPAPPGKKGGKADKKNADKSGGPAVPPVEINSTPTDSADPAADALLARAAEPVGLAELFTAMCTAVDVPCETVKGTLKGILDALGKPVGFLPWAWNIVSLITDETKEGKEKLFMIDLPLSMVHLNARVGSMPAERAATAGKGDGKSGGEKGKGGAAPPPPTEAAAADGEDPHQNKPPGVPSFTYKADYTSHFQPWYFLTDPRQFAALHYPDDNTRLLLARHVNRTAWEIYPRLTHDFFLLKIKLESHARRCVMTAKSVPQFISFKVNDLVHTEMCAVVFKGGVAQLSPSLQEDVPIDPRFVWQQRQEKQGRITFSMMVPDVGLHTVMIGARQLPNTVGNAQMLQTTPFIPLMNYQVNVSFVAVNEPMYPLQRISPSIAKVVEPLGMKLLTTVPQRFVVVPTVPTVKAIAVVNRVYKVDAPVKKDALSAPPPVAQPAAPNSARSKPTTPATDKKKGAKSATPAEPNKPVDAQQIPQEPEKEIDRVLLHLLEPHPEQGCFSGEYQLEAGLVEVWVLLRDDSAVPKPYTVHTAALASPSKSTQNGADGGANRSPTQGDAPPLPTGGAQAVPPTGSDTHRSGAGMTSSRGGPNGDSAAALQTKFVPVVTNMLAVKRIPAKDLSLNDGKPLIQPSNNLDEDLHHTLRLLSRSTPNGREWSMASTQLVDAPLHAVGSYFTQRDAAAGGTYY